MAHRVSGRSLAVMSLAIGILQMSAATDAQEGVSGGAPLPDGPLIFDSSTRGSRGSQIPGGKFRVVPMRGLVRPYGLAFLPDGTILITERAGQLRIVRDGKLDPRPIEGMPEVRDRSLKGLNDVALHP